MFISLSSSYGGNACAIKQSITSYSLLNSENEKNQFFDWLVTSMKSINEVLEGKQILFETNYEYPNVQNTTTIKFFNFHYLISYHDIDKFNDNSINEITEKYNKRYERLINKIKSQSKIYFIRYCKNASDIEENQINIFYNNIKNINNQLFFKFILISDFDNLIIPETLLTKENFVFINLNDYIDEDILNETNYYCKIVKQYKCIFNIIK